MESVTKVMRPQCIRLFDEDAYIKAFDAVVTGCEAAGEGLVKVSLDRTAFFPEGGGQEADTGVMRSADTAYRVLDAQEIDGQIWHTVDIRKIVDREEAAAHPFAAGMLVSCQLDWDERFDRMQNHSGEHIVSGLINRHYGYDNIGFHMGSEFITIDISGPLTMEQLFEIEQEANAIIWADVKTDIHTYSEEDIRNVTYRSKKELIGDVRIVSFPGADTCACCGTHVSSSGQIGLIKIFSAEAFHGGVRVEMLSGRRAYAYIHKIWMQNHEISVQLKAKPLESAAAVGRIRQQAADNAYAVIAYQEKEIERKASDMTGCGDVVLFEEGLSSDLVRKMCDAVMNTCGGRCLVFSGSDAEGYKYCVGQVGADLRAFVKGMNSALAGRGGGRPYFAQGSVTAKRADIEAWLSQA